MEERNYKKNGIKILILFIIAFIFIMFLPEIRSMININAYEKKQQVLIDKKEEEETKIENKKTLSSIICSTEDNTTSYQFSYDTNGLKKYTVISNTEFSSENEEEINKELELCQKENETKEKGIEVKCDYNNGTITKSSIYDYTTMTEKYRKENIFEFNYNESVNKIKNNLESKGYTCG